MTTSSSANGISSCPASASASASASTSSELDSPLLHTHQPDSATKRTGTVWTAVAHIITAVIGSGVLSLAWSIAQLGWIAGPLAIICFACITLFSASLLCDCYRSPNPEHGPSRNRSYLEAVDMSLGKKKAWVCGLLVQVSLYGIGVAYTVTSAISVRAIQKSNCYQKQGHEVGCGHGNTMYMLLFGLVQIVLSQIPDLDNVNWLSVLAAFMSFTYSFIGFGLALALVIENGHVKGSIAGVSSSSAMDKVWNVSQALGDIAFGYPYTAILLEIQDTLKSPPSESRTMKKASRIAIFITTFVYLCCGGFGYAAFGEDTPGNLLTKFGYKEAYWLPEFANACIVVHLLGGYQVVSQPVFASIEKWIDKKHPNNRFRNCNFVLKLTLLPAFELNLLALCFRTVYVVSTTGIATIFPYFNQVLGVLGGLNFWPLTIYFPVEMYCKQRNIEPWTKKWIVLQAFSIVCLFATAFTLIGSVQGLIKKKLN